MKYCSWMMDPLTALLIFWMTTLNYIKHPYHPPENQGITRTRENAAAAALGTYIFWIDADDYADESFLKSTSPIGSGK